MYKFGWFYACMYMYVPAYGIKIHYLFPNRKVLNFCCNTNGQKNTVRH